MRRKKQKALFQENYTHNTRMDRDPAATTRQRILNDQNGMTGRNFRYGKYPASHNACETIAIHNGLVLLGMESTLSEVMLRCQQCAAMIGKGFFGSNPYALGRVLDSYGIRWERVRLPQIRKVGVYILSYWNKGAPFHGLHTVAVLFDGTNYTTYNLGNGSFRELPQIYARRYICGYYLSR